jgi:hypothetical protein
MNNVEFISSEYSIIDPEGEVHFETAGNTFCLLNTCVMMLKDGDIFFEGREEELTASPDPYIRRFIRGR